MTLDDASNTCINVLLVGSFEIALLRLCRAFDPDTNSVIFGNTFISLEAFTGLREYNISIKII